MQERRRYPRHPCALPVACRAYAATNEALEPGTVLDLSRAGLRVEVSRPVTVGNLLRVYVRDAAADAPDAVLALVIRAAPSVDERWHLGCELMPEIDEADVRALLRGV